MYGNLPELNNRQLCEFSAHVVAIVSAVILLAVFFFVCVQVAVDWTHRLTNLN